MERSHTSILWFRLDLRLEDNLALLEAIKSKSCIIPVYIMSDDGCGGWAPGAASNWWLHHALDSLNKELQVYGSKLIIRQGSPQAELHKIIKETGASAVFWNRCYEPHSIARDTDIKKELQSSGLAVSSYNSNLLFDPVDIKNKSGKPFQVFTPFWKHCIKQKWRPVENVPLQGICSPEKWPASLSLDKLNLLPKIPWDQDITKIWDPTLAGAKKHLKRFIKDACGDYKANRDFPSLEGTSKLSPYLHFGQLSPHQVANKVPPGIDGKVFISELGWREFAHHLLYHFPHTIDKPLRSEFDQFPWEEDEELIKAWQTGNTGFPIVDAGMRQLWQEGWMHNRVRMIVASILVKHLMQPWQVGAEWFWDTLVDADLASNTLGWQWAAGCGADAAPYFRIFNPILQGKKFDPDGLYVRKYIPELKGCPKSFIHEPWLVEGNFGDYPKTPIISHEKGRARALAAYEKFKVFKNG